MVSVSSNIDVVDLCQRLIRCPSVTPVDAGAIDILIPLLKDWGFSCHDLWFGTGDAATRNLFAIRDCGGKHFCFAGHTDVVPAGDLESWWVDPFGGIIKDNMLVGRGAVDMKGGIACFMSALGGFLKKDTQPHTISLMITGDEEGCAIHGTPEILQWLQKQSYPGVDFCLIGEPVSRHTVGDTIKIGRRGSMNVQLTIHGRQGHVAYPEKSENPVHAIVNCLHTLKQGPKEKASDLFQPTNLEITSVDVGNETVNLIPEKAKARFNIRFNDQQTPHSLETWIKTACTKHTSTFDLDFEVHGKAASLPVGPLTDWVQKAMVPITRERPLLTTDGASSDARFIQEIAPVMEVGLLTQTMHQVNERVPVSDLARLKDLYRNILDTFFLKSPTYKL